ncbi:hypothetical protein RIR_jg26864.t1 [Rhizophagus irregularis DAOM 181602=DAOM 197198]|nr:hypothetical protein RIR_jg26864.t1 [Rhizophagus irregularis DAOM 181602=DAOM 197198]
MILKNKEPAIPLELRLQVQQVLILPTNKKYKGAFQRKGIDYILVNIKYAKLHTMYPIIIVDIIFYVLHTIKQI